MNKIVFVYDNRIRPNAFVESIIGDKSFADVITKRESVRHKIRSLIEKLEFIHDIIELNYEHELTFFKKQISEYPPNTRFIHYFSFYIIKEQEEANLSFQKICYIQKPFILTDDHNPVSYFFCGTSQYLEFIADNPEKIIDSYYYRFINPSFDISPANAFLNIGDQNKFQQYLSGSFDARYFNNLKGDSYTVTKTSTNKEKIYKEYCFYHLLPEHMKTWFVIPYNYSNSKESASYTMERYFIPDVAIRWIHGAISLKEFEQLLEKIFYFIQIRSIKKISKIESENIRSELYLNKVTQRLMILKEHQDYHSLNDFIKMGTKYTSIDDIISFYKCTYEKMCKRYQHPCDISISHGDLCFSNMLYHNGTSILKLIDSKGAINEEELWLDSYYDIVKLSHSICGKYDFFNNSFHEITIDDNMNFLLTIDFDNSKYVDVFRSYLTQNGYEYNLVRLYEASLFLSMLPLHMDYKQKVFGFILNAINILEELNDVF